MAWYNNWGDLTGDLNDIVHLRNPTNNPPPLPIAPGGPNTNPYGFGKQSTGQQTSVNTSSPQPVYPTVNSGSTMGDSGDGGDGGDGGSFLGNVGSSILDFVKDHGGDIFSAITDFAKAHGTDALAAYNVYLAAQRGQQADKYAQSAFQTGTDAYNAKAPLRALGIAGMQNPSANVPDLSNIRQISTAGSGNPFARALPVAGAATQFKAGTPAASLPSVPASQSTYPAPGQPGSLPLALAPAMTGQRKVGGFDANGKPTGPLPIAGA